jgi:hypothetical protein
MDTSLYNASCATPPREASLPLNVIRDDLPILRLRYVGEYSDAELATFLGEIDAVLKEPGEKVGVIDLVQATPGSATQRRIQAEWIRTNERVLAQAFRAAAIVTDNALIRGTVTAVFWIRPLPMPTHMAATVADAERWLAPYIAKLR